VNRLVVVALVALGVAAALFGAYFLTSPGSGPSESTSSAPMALPPSAAPAPSRQTPAPGVVPAPAGTTQPRRPVASKPEVAPAPAVIVAPDLVTLRVDSDVPGAQVFVDRVFLGKTPLTTTDVKPGSHRLNVSAPGYDGVARDIDVAPGSREITVSLREVRLDLSLAVVHKHRMGSCRGRLLATPSGLRYETTDKDDAFSAPLVNLETLEVDYLEKNLRIKLPQGKRYDFTDPEGNADHLFVFHRDVEKARERLKKGDPPAVP
jgi:hypothetical protein